VKRQGREGKGVLSCGRVRVGTHGGTGGSMVNGSTGRACPCHERARRLAWRSGQGQTATPRGASDVGPRWTCGAQGTPVFAPAGRLPSGGHPETTVLLPPGRPAAERLRCPSARGTRWQCRHLLGAAAESERPGSPIQTSGALARAAIGHGGGAGEVPRRAAAPCVQNFFGDCDRARRRSSTAVAVTGQVLAAVR
jgi:hypothetical protein